MSNELEGYEKVEYVKGDRFEKGDMLKSLAGVFDACSLNYGHVMAELGHAELWRPVPQVEVLVGNKKYRLFRTPEGFRFERFAGGRWWVEIIGMFPDFAAEEILTLRARIAELEANRPLGAGDRVKRIDAQTKGRAISLFVLWDNNTATHELPHLLTRIEAQP